MTDKTAGKYTKLEAHSRKNDQPVLATGPYSGQEPLSGELLNSDPSKQPSKWPDGGTVPAIVNGREYSSIANSPSLLQRRRPQRPKGRLSASRVVD
jgi:hypothetical protein